MRLKSLLSVFLLGIALVAAKSRWDEYRWAEHLQKRQAQTQTPTPLKAAKRDYRKSRFMTKHTKEFFVDGSSLPDVGFDAGESYAGSLPNDENADYFFWFWPTTAAHEPKEIVIWLNGGPGCSSLDGFLKENGAFVWPNGAPYPLQNPWSYHHLSNVVYVDQPALAGFSTGNVTARNEEDIARQFNGFWKNFMDTFNLHGYKVYISGESYAGMYCPYIGAAMLDEEDDEYFNVAGMMVNDGIIGYGELTEATINYFYENWKSVIPLNDSTAAELRKTSEACGYNEYLDKWLTYPPSGTQPRADEIFQCDSPFDLLIGAALEINPGFNLYQITQLPPVPWDVLGFPYSNQFQYPNESIYFAREDVKKALHAPLDVDWKFCNGPVFAGPTQSDESEPAIFRALPKVIEKTQNVQINHATLDMILTVNATLLTIQNMTWNGETGLSDMPREPLFVPRHSDPFAPTASGEGVLGSWIEERGLTVGIVPLNGHLIPALSPGVSFRQVQALLGRIDNLSSTEPLPQAPDAKQPEPSELGKGTAGTNWGRVLEK